MQQQHKSSNGTRIEISKSEFVEVVETGIAVVGAVVGPIPFYKKKSVEK